MPQSGHAERVLPWLLRAAWVALLFVGGEAIDAATADRGAGLRNAATAASFLIWLIGLFALAIPAVRTLTAARLIVPLSVPVATLSAAAGASGIDAAIFVAVALLSTMIVGTAEIGRRFVQASAYGEEDRFPLRPPTGYLIAAGLAWAIWAATLIAAPLTFAAQRWVVGVLATAVALAVTVLGWPRWHRLSERWFVVVPIGVVLHDPLVLSETLMLRRQELARIRLAPAATEAADLTGPAAGHAIEINTTESVTAIFAGTPKQPSGTAIHLTACLAAPSRPGAALAAAGARRLAVG